MYASAGLKVEGALEPLGSTMLVRTGEPEETTSSGLVLPKREKPTGGEVVAVGPGEVDPDTGAARPPTMRPGTKVLYSKFSGRNAVEVSGVDHVLLREDDVLVSYTGEDPALDNLQMPRGRILVRLLESDDTTDSGLVLSKSAVEDTTTVGEVVAVGPGELSKVGEELAPPVAQGDMVRFRFGDRVELDIGKERFSSVRAGSCLAKWKA